MKINHFRGYRYRRYSVALNTLSVAWAIFVFYAMYHVVVDIRTAALVLCTALVVSLPATLLAGACDVVADSEFAYARWMKGL